jgi:hypothetical protein
MLSFVKPGQFKANKWDDPEYVRKQFERSVTEMKKIKFIGPDGWNLTKADRWAKVNGDKRLEYRLGCAERAEQQMLKHGLIQPLTEPFQATQAAKESVKLSELSRLAALQVESAHILSDLAETGGTLLHEASGVIKTADMSYRWSNTDAWCEVHTSSRGGKAHDIERFLTANEVRYTASQLPNSADPMYPRIAFAVTDDDYRKFSDLVVASKSSREQAELHQVMSGYKPADATTTSPDNIERMQRSFDYKQAITADWETAIVSLRKLGVMDEHGWIVSDESLRRELAKDDPEVAKALETYAVAENQMQAHKMFDEYNPVNPTFSTMKREEVKQSAEIDRLVNSLLTDAPLAGLLLKFFVEFMRGYNEEAAKLKAAAELNDRIERLNARASSIINLTSVIVDKPGTEALQLGTDSVLENQQLQLEYKATDAQVAIAQGLERIAEILRNAPTENMDVKLTQVYGIQCSMLNSLAAISGDNETYAITGSELSGDFGEAMADFNSVDAKTMDDRLAAMKITFSATKAPEDKISELKSLTEKLKLSQATTGAVEVGVETVTAEALYTGLATAEDVENALENLQTRKAAGVGMAEINKSLSK